MGKRKRAADQHHNSNDPPASSDNIPCSSGTEALSKQKLSQFVDSSDLKPFSSGMEITDNSVKLLNAHHHYNLGRSVFLKRSRHHYSHQYSRRNLGNHGNGPSSLGKGPPSREERLSFKLASHCNTEPGSHAEKREKPFSRSERIRFSSLVTNAASPDTVKIVCGICQKLLRRKSHLLGMGSTIPSGEQHAVAVLVCGHVYHADCLEKRTSAEDIRDPPCPLCLGSLTQVESSGVQE